MLLSLLTGLSLTVTASLPTTSLETPELRGPREAVHSVAPGGSARRGAASGSSLADYGDREEFGVGGTRERIGTGYSVTTTPVPGKLGLYDLRLTGTGTGWVEKFLLQVPNVSTDVDVPLLVGFHQYSVSHNAIRIQTEFLDEAISRGWYAVLPLGATDINFSSLDSQINTEFVLRWVMKRYNVDRNRIYGVGFSMGGGNVLNYAARHLDPARGMFAAIVNHTGSVSVRDVYLSDPGVRWALDILFEGTPDQQTFSYQRSSVIDLDPVTRAIVPNVNHATNLVHIPMQTWVGTDDPLTYLREQNLILASHLDSIGANHTVVEVPTTGHSWDTLDETAVCDFLAQHTLTLPTSGSILADRDGTYFHMNVTQRVTDSFTRFRWVAEPENNKFSVLSAVNLQQLVVHSVENGLDPTQPVRVPVLAQDGQGVEVILTGFSSAPVAVTRDGAPESAWNYDASSSTLRLIEPAGGFHVWDVAPN